jgi:hypothetical protein
MARKEERLGFLLKSYYDVTKICRYNSVDTMGDGIYVLNTRHLRHLSFLSLKYYRILIFVLRV